MSVTASRMLAREWRGGELGVLVMALVLAVGLVSGISAFTTRLQSALELESHRFLAADVAVSADQAMPLAWQRHAAERGISTARTLAFPSMIYAGSENMVLASIKAVTPNYPLRGKLTYSDVAFGAIQQAPAGPRRGEVWLDSRLFALLDVEVGQRVSIGEASFEVVAAARTEPDQTASVYGFGPRALMNFEDIPLTGVVQPGSRVEYRQLFAGDPAVMAAFKEWLQPRLTPAQRLLDVRAGQPAIGSALQRAESFLLLAGSLGVVLAGVAIALAARRFSERHADYVAIMKSLGATSRTVNWLYGRSLLLLGCLSTLLGSSLGWVLQSSFFSLFADQLPVQPGPGGVRPYAIGAVTAITCLLCFAWPPLRRLGQTSPLRVLRRDLPLENRRSLRDYLIGLAAMTVLMWWYSRDLFLTLSVLTGLAVIASLGLLLALTLLRGSRLAGMRAGSIWRLALAGLQRRGTANAMQIVIFSMAIMLLLMLILVRTSLLDEWRTQLPEDAPNHFMVNISPDEVAGVQTMLREEQIASEPLYPMIRGRLMAVNGEPLPKNDPNGEGRRQRESNFTWAEQLPAGNTLLSGQWWTPRSKTAVVSVEQDFAERMGLAVGDRLELLIGASSLEVTVASIRRLDWESMRPNFFLVFPPGLLATYPTTFMTSFYLPSADKAFLNRFVRKFPTISVIETDLVLDQLRNIVNQVSAAIELVLAVILAAGALVLIAGVQASVDVRLHESAILRALGASRRLLLGGLFIEFATLGLCAGLLATVGAELSVLVLQKYVLAMHYRPSPWLWPVGLATGLLLIGTVGVFSCRRVVSSPPLASLREL